MALNLLLVEDEPGIREGLTSFLQIKGFRVTAAESCAAGIRHLSGDDIDFDLVITDWHLGDGLGDAIASLAQCPVLVISGAKERMELPGLEVMQKPVMPADLVARIEAILGSTRPEQRATVELAAPLPRDAADRVALIKALIGSRQQIGPGTFEVLDDGSFVTVRAELEHEDASLLDEMMWVGGDVRCLDHAGMPLLEVRFYRTSQRSDEDILVGPTDKWPDGDNTIAVDFDDGPDAGADGGLVCPPGRMVELLHMATAAFERGRLAYFLNVPPHLRLHLELLGKAHAMPMREMAGPALPEILTELWR
jgi:DNA-binding response OmpR family regulator